MTDLFWRLAEEKIQQSYKNGDFNQLPGKGKPLKLKDLSGIPEDLRIAYQILQNAGYSIEENEIKKELMTIQDLLKTTMDAEEKAKLENEISRKLLQYNALLAKKRIPTNSSVFKKYQSKIEKRFL